MGVVQAMILGGTLSQKLPAEAQSGYVLFPLAIHAMDLVVSGIGIMMTEAPKGKSKGAAASFKAGKAWRKAWIPWRC